MNLVVDCMQVISGRPLAYFRRGQEGLLIRLFRRAFRNPALSEHRRELRAILDYVEDHNGREAIWKDCEIYYPVEFLSRSSETQCFPFLIEFLKILLGLEDIRRCKNLPEGYYRLKRLDGSVYKSHRGMVTKVGRDVLWKMRGFASDIYLPHNGMFSDILKENLYPVMKVPFDLPDLKSKVSRTIGLMGDFSRDIWEDFQDSIWNLVLLTNAPRAGTTSLTMRYKYFGGVFFNPFRNDEYSGVEALTHEYIHNRCWLWWEVASPTGVPPESVRIVSPVTGNEVKVSAMIQAFIIYLNALQFYRYIQTTNPPSEPGQRSRLNRRAAHLARNIPVLYRRLNHKVGKGTDIRRLFEYLMMVYESAEKAK